MKLLRSARWLLLAFAVTLIPVPSHASVFISVGFAPPPLLVYQQPMCPGPGMIWTPGYWAYGPYGYYWVPGAWVPAPFVGALWTPGYWGWNGGFYYWHPGYWGYNVGYYGGINYGFGYFGIGFVGGRWHDRDFEYNTAVWRVDPRYVRHTYYDHNDWDRHYVDRGSRVAFNGGPGGIRHAPDRQELAFEHEQRFERTAFQEQHVQSAMRDRNAYFDQNHGRPNRIVSERPLRGEIRSTPQMRPVNQRQQGNMNGRNAFYDNRSQAAPQNRQQQPQFREQQRPQYRQPQQPQQYRPQQPQYRGQPQYREQQRPQYGQPQQAQQYRQQQPQYRGAPQYREQQRPQYGQSQQPQQYRQQPQYRDQQQFRQPQFRQQPQGRQPQYRQQPQPRNENRGRPEGRPQPGGPGRGR